MYAWSDVFPLILVWTPFQATDWSWAFANTLQWKQSSFASSVRPDSRLGVDPSIVPIYSCVPKNNITYECRCYEQVATPVQTPVSGELVLMVERLEDVPISAAQTATWTWRNPLLSRVLGYIREGWPVSADIQLKLYRMKSLAPGLVWWPGMDQEIENMVTVQTVNKVDHLLPYHYQCYTLRTGQNTSCAGDTANCWTRQWNCCTTTWACYDSLSLSNEKAAGEILNSQVLLFFLGEEFSDVTVLLLLFCV